MNTNLSQYNEGNNNMIELIICNNDNMAEGCISALESAGYNNGTGKTIPVFGVDATDSAKELIANGKHDRHRQAGCRGHGCRHRLRDLAKGCWAKAPL